jgi:hypothetical protein
MKRGYLVLWFVTVLGIGGWAWWYLFAPGSVPAGQRAMGDEAAMREAFHAGVGKNRIVALLSPTTPADLVLAQSLQALLMEYENDTLDAHIVWQPLAQGDWAPTTDAMGRVWDGRARHYWDKEKKIRILAGEGRIFVYARGAGFDRPAVRGSGLDGVREFLGVPKPYQPPSR